MNAPLIHRCERCGFESWNLGSFLDHKREGTYGKAKGKARFSPSLCDLRVNRVPNSELPDGSFLVIR
jgi:hypothetical protein